MGADERIRQRVARRHAAAPGANPAPNGTGPADTYPQSEYDDSPPKVEAASNASKVEFPLMDSRTFAGATFPREFICKPILVKGQPAVYGGPVKAMKTSKVTDLALSMGTGGRFLGYFHCPKPLRVGVLSGESGGATLQETALRVAKQKGIDLADADVYWGLKLPQLADVTHVAALQETVEALGIEVLIYDPLYLGLLSGAGAEGLSASNLYQIGPLLLAVTEALLAVGCTPILTHHFKITRANHYAEPELGDLAYSGIQEFARQWLLVGRRQKYEPGTGSHRLWLSAGGSAGHGGLWAVDIEEGVLNEDFSGRRWDVEVMPAGAARAEEQSERDGERRQRAARQDDDDEAAVMAAVDKLDPGGSGLTRARLAVAARLSRPRFERAVARLLTTELLEDCPLTLTVGGGAKRQGTGVRRPAEAR